MQLTKWTKTVLATVLVGVIAVSSPTLTQAKTAALSEETGYTIHEDSLRRLMSKKLGTSYRAMDCSAYAAWVVTRLGKQVAGENAVSKLKIVSGRSSYDWRATGGIKVTYKMATLSDDAWTWSEEKTSSLNTTVLHVKNTKKALKQLEIGDALLYSGRSHIALYMGEFKSLNAMGRYLKEQCGMKGLKKGKTKAGNACLKYKGKPVAIHYKGCGNKWRIHSINTYGVVCDNDLTFHNGEYGGKWYKTVKYVTTRKTPSLDDESEMQEA